MGLKLLRRKRQLPATVTETNEAYDIWADFYDLQPDNLMLQLDQELFEVFLNETNLKGKTLLDFGCGTGRHWPQIVAACPEKLTGVDISPGMVNQLKKKFPEAVVYVNTDNLLSDIPDASLDQILSTLTIAHVQNAKELLHAFSRVLKKGGQLWITDYHPELLAQGGTRDFSKEGKKYVIRNYVHPVQDLISIAKDSGLQCQKLTERKIDEYVKPYYIKQKAISVYEKHRGVKIIYGISLIKL